jgi:hypothetical protein
MQSPADALRDLVDYIWSYAHLQLAYLAYEMQNKEQPEYLKDQLTRCADGMLTIIKRHVKVTPKPREEPEEEEAELEPLSTTKLTDVQLVGQPWQKYTAELVADEDNQQTVSLLSFDPPYHDPGWPRDEDWAKIRERCDFLAVDGCFFICFGPDHYLHRARAAFEATRMYNDALPSKWCISKKRGVIIRQGGPRMKKKNAAWANVSEQFLVGYKMVISLSTRVSLSLSISFSIFFFCSFLPTSTSPTHTTIHDRSTRWAKAKGRPSRLPKAAASLTTWTSTLRCFQLLVPVEATTTTSSNIRLLPGNSGCGSPPVPTRGGPG